MGKGKDHAKKGGGGKQFAESSDQIESRNVKKQSKARDLPPSSSSEEEESEDDEIIPVKAGKQNANAGMMPPSDDSEEEESEEEEAGPVATPAEMAAFIKYKGLDGELRAWLKAKTAKAGKVRQLITWASIVASFNALSPTHAALEFAAHLARSLRRRPPVTSSARKRPRRRRRRRRRSLTRRPTQRS